jgi:hypothetical protein
LNKAYVKTSIVYKVIPFSELQLFGPSARIHLLKLVFEAAQQTSDVVLKITEIEERSAGGSVAPGSDTMMEIPRDKSTAGPQVELPDEWQAETSRAAGLGDILQNQNIDKLGEQ